jgi:F-type H+-transporting ATPase subunit b
VKFNLTTFALAALIALGAGALRAQEEEPADEKAAVGDTGTTMDTGTTRAARKARRAARRAAMTRAEAAASIKSAPPLGPLHVAEAERNAKAQNPPSEKTAAAIDALSSLDGGIDSLPAIAPVTETTAREHEGTVAGHGHEGHGEAHGEGDAEHLADHGEHTGFSGKTFALQLLNFGVLLFLLIWFGGRGMNKVLRARHEQLKGDIGEAARLRDEAARKFQAQEQRVTDLEKEIASLRASMRQDAEREQARLLQGAQERAKRIQEDMRIQLDQQVKEAELLLRAEVASASVKLAEELVRKSVNADDERRLAREFVAGFDVPAGPQDQGQGEIR